MQWAVELGWVDNLMEVSLLSQYHANPRKGHLEALYLIFHYLWKKPLKRIIFDPTVPQVNKNQFCLDADWTEFYGYVVEEEPPDMLAPL